MAHVERVTPPVGFDFVREPKDSIHSCHVETEDSEQPAAPAASPAVVPTQDLIAGFAMTGQ